MQNPGKTRISYKAGQTHLTRTKCDPVDPDDRTRFQSCMRLLLIGKGSATRENPVRDFKSQAFLSKISRVFINIFILKRKSVRKQCYSQMYINASNHNLVTFQQQLCVVWRVCMVHPENFTQYISVHVKVACSCYLYNVHNRLLFMIQYCVQMVFVMQNTVCRKRNSILQLLTGSRKAKLLYRFVTKNIQDIMKNSDFKISTDSKISLAACSYKISSELRTPSLLMLYVYFAKTTHKFTTAMGWIRLLLLLLIKSLKGNMFHCQLNLMKNSLVKYTLQYIAK